MNTESICNDGRVFVPVKRSDEGELVWQNMCGIKKAIDILNKM